MPTTRSQTADTLRVYEDYPASPSVQASASRNVRTAARDTAVEPTTPEFTIPREPAAANPERRSRPPSVRSHRSTASAIARIRQAELDAEEQLAEIRRQELQLQASLIRKRLAADVATIREETDRESVGGDEAANADRRVSDWLNQSLIRGEGDPAATRECAPRTEVNERRVPNPEPKDRRRELTPERSRERGIEKLADTLDQMMRRRAPPRQTQDLPSFSGATEEWLPFKAAMRESTSMHGFSPAENLARLRASLKGEARQAVSALLYTATEPSAIMKTLEQCFGRPEIIIDRAINDLSRLPRLGASAAELNSFAIKLQNIVTIITGLDERGYLANPMLARIVTEKLSPHVKSKWCDYAEEYGCGREPEIVALSQFLMREADRAVRHAYAPTAPQVAPASAVRVTAGPKPETRPRRVYERNRGANVYTTTDSVEKSVCLCCGAEHKTVLCKKLIAMPVAQRWEWAKEARVCFQCLSCKHRRFHCPGKRCGVDECKRTHHALLHSPRGQPAENVAEERVAATAAKTHTRDHVLLKVCPITVRGPSGAVRTYALFDEGSTVTLVDEEIARAVGANGTPGKLTIRGVASSQAGLESETVDLSVSGRNGRQRYTIKARTMRDLSLGRQTVSAEVLNASHLRRLKAKDVCFRDARPRVLIGTDNWELIVSRKLLSGAKGRPAASLTRLGWVLHGTNVAPGRILRATAESVLYARTWQEARRDISDDLHEMVKEHFSVDALGISKTRKPIAAEERAIAIVERSAKLVNGRFEVGLPWASDNVALPPSYDMAFRRLRGIERKMDKSQGFRDSYTAEVNKLISSGYAERCVGDCESPRHWYLPHFAVTNPNKPGKVRLVSDAAARANNVCLNDVLLDGPDLLRSLQGILFRFREGPVAITADIREMFLRIKIRPEDRVAQHFLWRGDDRSGPPQKYVMASMIFGARSSPFIAHSVRDRNARDHRESHPRAYEAITRSHYMDDWVDSFDSEKLATQAIAEVCEVHGRAGFELARWSSNRARILGGVSEGDMARAPRELGATAGACGKALGVCWLPDTDQLAFNVALHRVPSDVRDGHRTPTKREALSAVMSLFDPLGLVSPYTVTAKIMLQGLWRQKLGWDEPIPDNEATIFREWLADREHIGNLRLPRYYGMLGNAVGAQLHVFCDASEQAYATAAYWRYVDRGGCAHVILAAGKARVTPLKALTIPRLELQACLIGARLAAEIIKEHRIAADVVLWSDSKTALQWIRNESARYTSYVAHRLGEIAELTRPEQWRWVPTGHNVADDATRAGYTHLSPSDRWFTGPDFLREPQEEWPRETTGVETSEEVLVTRVREEHPVINISRFSSWEKICRTLARVLAAVDIWRHRESRSRTEYIERAELMLLKQAQEDSFSAELTCLKNGKSVGRSSRLYRLDPEYGPDGLIRLRGRINAAAVHESLKRPPVIDGSHPIAKLLIQREHAASHIGTEHIVNNLRQRYWILRLRPVAKGVVRACVTCRIRRAAPAVPVKGDLPEARLRAYVRPFTTCGVDCFGPMWVTVGRRREKRWGMLFTCLVIRAVHIELVDSLSTDSALMAFRRMAARRGWPQVIYSDNGTNFRGAEAELALAYKEWLPALQDVALAHRTEWRFTDPGAPNQGGAWERLIRSVKRSLAVALNERAPRGEVLYTVLTEIEHTINSRPLTHVSVDPDDIEALTPNHFLLGSAVGLPYQGTSEITDKRAWRAAQALADAFWGRWMREYLPTLTPRGDHRAAREEVKAGDVVVIADGLLPRNVWPKGRVARVYVGPDGVTRSADVETRGGVFRRPVRRLIVLPIMCGGAEDQRRGEAVADDEPNALA